MAKNKAKIMNEKAKEYLKELGLPKQQQLRIWKDGEQYYKAFFLDKLLTDFANQQVEAIRNELISIKRYMESNDAYYGYGQMTDLIQKLKS